MNIQLPPDVLQVRARAGNTPSPLASYLSEIIHVRDSLPRDSIKPVVLGALATATLPFDPQEIIQLEARTPLDQLKGRRYTLLEAALRLAEPEHPLAPKRAWPMTAEGFGSALRDQHDSQRPNTILGAPTINAEWLAAALVAGGCNPWKDGRKDPDGLPAAVELAVHFGYSGLLERFLKAPGAWDAQRVWDARTGYGKQSLAEIASRLGSPNVLEVLLEHGARPSDEKDLVKLLIGAREDTVKALGRFVSLKLSNQSAQEAISAWKRVRAREEISARDLARMSALVTEGPDEDQTYAQIKMEELLASEWGKRPNGSQAMAYDFMPGHNPKSLVARQIKKGGPSAGEWSVLAAAAFARIRQGNKDGALGWSTAVMLPVQVDERTKRQVRPDLESPELKGSLKEALGFDWRPGIAIDGVVALSLLGQRGDIEPGLPRTAKDKEALEADWRDFGLASGVEDVYAWATENAQAAADFTLSVLKNPTVNQASSMLHTWAAALERNPDMARAISPDAGANLLLAFTANFKALDGFPLDASYVLAMEKMAKSLFPSTPGLGSELKTGPVDDPEAKASLIMLLNSPGGDFMEAVEPHIQDIPGEHLKLLEWRAQAMGASAKTRAALKQIKAWELDRSLPEPSRKKGPGARL